MARITEKLHPSVLAWGVPITTCEMIDVRSFFARWLSSEERTPHKLATVNLDFIRMTAEDPAFYELLMTFEHRFADGWPVLRMCEKMGNPFTRARHRFGSDPGHLPMVC